MTYAEFEASILFEYPETDPSYLNMLIRRVLDHVNELVGGRYIEEKMIAFSAGTGTPSTGYSWIGSASSPPVLTLPSLRSISKINYKDTSTGKMYPIENFPWERFWDNEQLYACYHYMSSSGIRLSSFIIAAACELWIECRKSVSLTPITTPSTVLSMPEDWIPVIEAGVLTELSAGTDKWKTRLPVYREMLASLRQAEETNYPEVENQFDYNYQTGTDNSAKPEKVDDGIHNWWPA